MGINFNTFNIFNFKNIGKEQLESLSILFELFDVGQFNRLPREQYIEHTECPLDFFDFVLCKLIVSSWSVSSSMTFRPQPSLFVGMLSVLAFDWMKTV